MDTQTAEGPNTTSLSSRSKRKTPACLQCRDRKVRCSGTCPCVNCTRRSEGCVFEQDEKKVLVSERLFNDLKRRVGNGEFEHISRPRKRQMTDADAEIVVPSNGMGQDESRRQPHDSIPEDNDDDAMKNPLVVSPSKFLTDIKGRRRFLGPSSTWAYSRHVIGLLKDHLHYHESPEMSRNVDGIAFPLDLPQVKLPESCVDLGTLPPLDYAIYLTNTVKFHVGQAYHFLDESVFMANLFSLYNDGVSQLTSTARLWLSQYFIVMALGKAFLHRGFSKSCPFGKDYFLRGMEFMPDISGLHDDPVLAMEVCCAIALYLQSVDHRNTAFVYLGIALRVALSQGIHHDPIDDSESRSSNERQRSAWWTLYMLDRKFSYMMGSPSQINDDSITITLPGSPYHSPQKVIAIDVHVKLCRLIGKIVDTVYAVNGKLGASFLRIMQSTLQELASLAETLTSSIDLNFDGSNPINRTSGTLNLCYHQCIMLATRPLLVCLLREKLRRRAATDVARRDLAEPIKALLRASSDSANKSLRILSALQDRDLLDVFLPFDLEYAFSAAFILMLTDTIHSFSKTVDPGWMESVLSTIDSLVESGHVSARFRREEVEQLHDMLRQVVTPGVEFAAGSGDETLNDTGNSAGVIQGVSSTEMLSIADLMSCYPMMEINPDFLEGDWLWEDNLASWQGMSLPGDSEQVPRSG